MQRVNKIFWRIGQEITPDTFIQADNYTCFQHDLIRRLIAGKYFGLLPEGIGGVPSFTVSANLNNKDFYLVQLDCCGVTEAGHLVLFEPDLISSLPQRQIPLPTANANAFYVVLRVNPYEQVLIEPVYNDEAPEAHPVYELAVRELNQISADELAIVKIDNSNRSLSIDWDYIPPCMSVNACAGLLEVFSAVKRLFSEIHTIIENKKGQFGKLLYPLSLLHYELDEFELSNPPIALVRLIKKFMITYQFFITDLRKIMLPDALHEYCHNDVSITFKSLLSYLQEVKLMVGKVEIVEEEDFTPKI